MTGWQEHAACRIDPDLWFVNEDRPMAMHICLYHCPVLPNCRREAEVRPPREGVQAGVAYSIYGRPVSKPKPAETCVVCPRAKSSPTDTGACGRYSGYQRHLYRNEVACNRCLAAAARRRVACRRRVREAA